ncbi:MAG TPA: hypothetical protein DDY31_01550 [Lachnospiraceae bacterium]|nr:hypothetical protein [Lachnospiraceae bacterium]
MRRLAEEIIKKGKVCLAAYEDTGLTPEQIKEMDRLYAEKCEEVVALKKQIEREKTAKMYVLGGDKPGVPEEVLCPKCEHFFGYKNNFKKSNYCPNCGQKMKWD